MSRYHDLAEMLQATSDELLEDVDMTTRHECHPTVRRLEGAAGYILRAAELLLELDVGPELAEEVRALQELCVCGVDRGDHMTADPFPTEDGACPGYRAARRDTLADFMTEPAPAPMGDAS